MILAFEKIIPAFSKMISAMRRSVLGFCFITNAESSA